MNDLFKKMNFKASETVLVLNAPLSFEPHMSAMEGLTRIERAVIHGKKTNFILAFCTLQADIDVIARDVLDCLEDDGLLWFAYPKGTSKRFKCDFNRDTGWAVLGELGFEPVRMVAIDEDWSALRFRKVEFIKKMTRNSALSKEGKQRIK